MYSACASPATREANFIDIDRAREDALSDRAGLRAEKEVHERSEPKSEPERGWGPAGAET